MVTKLLRPTVESLVTEGLGYCCQFAFFSIHKQTALIATRLGVSTRAVRYAKERVNNGTEKCRNCPNCMKDKISKLRKL